MSEEVLFGAFPDTEVVLSIIKLRLSVKILVSDFPAPLVV